METTAIRLQVPRDVYEKLVAEQKKRRHDAGHKTSLADIVIEFCENVLKNLQSEQKSVRNNGKPTVKYTSLLVDGKSSYSEAGFRFGIS